MCASGPTARDLRLGCGRSRSVQMGPHRARSYRMLPLTGNPRGTAASTWNGHPESVLTDVRPHRNGFWRTIRPDDGIWSPSESRAREAATRCGTHTPQPGADDDRASRIVLVDDEEALAWFSRVDPTRASRTTALETATTERTALIGDSPIDLLIADIRMPGMSGIDSGARGPSAYPNCRHRDDGVPVRRHHEHPRRPLHGFLEKPFEFERLREQVDEALAHARRPGFSGAISVQTFRPSCSSTCSRVRRASWR